MPGSILALEYSDKWDSFPWEPVNPQAITVNGRCTITKGQMKGSGGRAGPPTQPQHPGEAAQAAGCLLWVSRRDRASAGRGARGGSVQTPGAKALRLTKQ